MSRNSQEEVVFLLRGMVHSVVYDAITVRVLVRENTFRGEIQLRNSVRHF